MSFRLHLEQALSWPDCTSMQGSSYGAAVINQFYDTLPRDGFYFVLVALSWCGSRRGGGFGGTAVGDGQRRAEMHFSNPAFFAPSPACR